MTRTERLFQMMNVLRMLPPPATAQELSHELGVSERTVYRDIDSLRSLGAGIDGEAGFGYTLIEDATLPPLGFEEDELEALVLGLREVTVTGDPTLAKAAKSALAKLRSRLPPRQSHRLQHAVLDARRFYRPPSPTVDMAKLRKATWEEVLVSFAYTDGKGQSSERQVKPLGIVFLDDAHVLLSWCLLRRDFRSFRLDRMTDLVVQEDSFRPERVPLLREVMEKIRGEIAETAQDRRPRER